MDEKHVGATRSKANLTRSKAITIELMRKWLEAKHQNVMEWMRNAQERQIAKQLCKKQSIFDRKQSNFDKEQSNFDKKQSNFDKSKAILTRSKGPPRGARLN